MTMHEVLMGPFGFFAGLGLFAFLTTTGFGLMIWLVASASE